MRTLEEEQRRLFGDLGESDDEDGHLMEEMLSVVFGLFGGIDYIDP